MGFFMSVLLPVRPQLIVGHGVGLSAVITRSRCFIRTSSVKNIDGRLDMCLESCLLTKEAADGFKRLDHRGVGLDSSQAATPPRRVHTALGNLWYFTTVFNMLHCRVAHGVKYALAGLAVYLSM